MHKGDIGSHPREKGGREETHITWRVPVIADQPQEWKCTMYFNSFLPFHRGCFKPPSRLNRLTEGNQTLGRLIMSTHDAAKVDLRFLGGEKERKEETEAPKVPVQRDGNWKRTNKTE